MEHLNNDTHTDPLVTLHMLICAFVHLLQYSINFLHVGEFTYFLSCADHYQKSSFSYHFSVLQLECQTVWIHFRSVT